MTASTDFNPEDSSMSGIEEMHRHTIRSLCFIEIYNMSSAMMQLMGFQLVIVVVVVAVAMVLLLDRHVHTYWLVQVQ